MLRNFKNSSEEAPFEFALYVPTLRTFSEAPFGFSCCLARVSWPKNPPRFPPGGDPRHRRGAGGPLRFQVPALRLPRRADGRMGDECTRWARGGGCVARCPVVACDGVLSIGRPSRGGRPFPLKEIREGNTTWGPFLDCFPELMRVCCGLA